MRAYLFAAALAPLLASQPQVRNFKQETRSAAAGLANTVRTLAGSQVSPAWIAYAVPLVSGERSMCCWNSNVQGRGCTLEPQNENTAFPIAAGTVHLEGASEFFVFLRVENRKVEKIRTFSVDCAIDGGGLPLYLFTEARANESVALLESLLPEDGDRSQRQLAHGAIAAIALHRDSSADAALDRLIVPARSEDVRRQVVFWLGNARGRNGYESVLRVLREDPSAAVRDHAVFSLTLSKEPQAFSNIVRVAHDDKSPHVRGQALFWLAKKGPPQSASAAIRTALDQDPDLEVKKKAIFALTQMPGGGIPMLIEAARSSRNEAVRKLAFFWLGRSKDARAIHFFEEILAAR